jgi:hypothetical protein
LVILETFICRGASKSVFPSILQMSLTPAAALQAVGDAAALLDDTHIKIFTTRGDGKDGPKLDGNLAQYVVWTVAGVLEEKHIGDGDTETKNALLEQLKASLGKFEKEVDKGYRTNGFSMERSGGGAKNTRRRRRRHS